MPYIPQDERALIDNEGALPTTAGQLNYLISRICFDYYRERGGRYQQISDVVGALDGAKLEFYRRVAAPYEDEKIKQNGDVYL